VKVHLNKTKRLFHLKFHLKHLKPLKEEKSRIKNQISKFKNQYHLKVQVKAHLKVATARDFLKTF